LDVKRKNRKKYINGLLKLFPPQKVKMELKAEEGDSREGGVG